jgi:hypothetical protein
MVEPKRLRATALRVDLQRVRTIRETAACAEFDSIFDGCRVVDGDACSINDTPPCCVCGRRAPWNLDCTSQGEGGT